MTKFIVRLEGIADVTDFGYLYITCDKLKADLDSDRILYADGVMIELDEDIIDIEEVKEED